MSKSEPQNLQNHGRLDPPYHFVLFFVLVANVVISIVYVVKHPCFYSAWFVVLSVAAILALLKMRMYPMNWAWWDGKMPVEQYKHEHELDTESLKTADGEGSDSTPAEK